MLALSRKKDEAILDSNKEAASSVDVKSLNQLFKK